MRDSLGPSSKFFKANKVAVPSDDLEYKDTLPPGASSAFTTLLLALDWLYKPPIGKHDTF